jgi:RNA polymerase sigma-70 factor (ECF subfamily)
MRAALGKHGAAVHSTRAETSIIDTFTPAVPISILPHASWNYDSRLAESAETGLQGSHATASDIYREIDYASLEDDALIRLAADGRAEALSELYDRYARMIFGLALITAGDRYLAEEITQDVFLRVWEKSRSYRSEQSKVVTWITSIARHRTIDLFRHSNISPEGHCISLANFERMELPDNVDVENEVERSQSRQNVQWAVSQLPAEQRQALTLAYFRGLSVQEIAAALNAPLGTIKARIRLGKYRLRYTLKSENE